MPVSRSSVGEIHQQYERLLETARELRERSRLTDRELYGSQYQVVVDNSVPLHLREYQQSAYSQLRRYMTYDDVGHFTPEYKYYSRNGDEAMPFKKRWIKHPQELVEETIEERHKRAGIVVLDETETNPLKMHIALKSIVAYMGPRDHRYRHGEDGRFMICVIQPIDKGLDLYTKSFQPGNLQEIADGITDEDDFDNIKRFTRYNKANIFVGDDMPALVQEAFAHVIKTYKTIPIKYVMSDKVKLANREHDKNEKKDFAETLPQATEQLSKKADETVYIQQMSRAVRGRPVSSMTFALATNDDSDIDEDFHPEDDEPNW